MIYDCFTYFNEDKILDIRVNELKDSNIKHILIESPYTFTGEKKELNYINSEKKYDSVIAFSVEDMPNNGNSWDNEIYQRNYIKKALEFMNVNDDDVIIISDVDEIPKREVVINFYYNSITSLSMNVYSYWLNYLVCKDCWNHARIMKWSNLKETTPEETRHIGCYENIKNAGWHFTYMGGVDRMIKKVESFSHTEVNTIEYKNKLTNEYNNCIPIKIDSTYPSYIVNNIEKFKQYIK
jgi:beta-1,4-mannosyl-glycoprotein beta-1,4-N-acetylglucosaminyltransferase